MRNRGFTILLGAAAFLHGLAEPLLAQVPARLPEESSGIIPWVVAGAVAAICCATGFINPKRSHRS